MTATDLLQLKERGRGAFGVVYEMKHRDSGTIMAVKVCILISSLLCFCCSQLLWQLPRYNLCNAVWGSFEVFCFLIVKSLHVKGAL